MTVAKLALKTSKTELIFRLFLSSSVPLPPLSGDGHDRPVILIHGGPPGLSLRVNDSYHGSLQASAPLSHLQSFSDSVTGEQQRGCKTVVDSAPSR